jgi:hypothetical protein
MEANHGNRAIPNMINLFLTFTLSLYFYAVEINLFDYIVEFSAFYNSHIQSFFKYCAGKTLSRCKSRVAGNACTAIKSI